MLGEILVLLRGALTRVFGPAPQALLARPTTRPLRARSALLSSLWRLHLHEQALGAQTVAGALVLRCAQCIGPYQRDHFLFGCLLAQRFAIVGVIADEHGIEW